MKSLSANMFAKLLGISFILLSHIIFNESVSALENNAAVGNTANVPEGYTSFPEDHAAYKVYKIPSTWQEARDLCIAEGATLAMPDTREKVSHISSLTTAFWKWFIVGFYKEKNGERWLRADNDQPAATIPWRRSANLDMDCAAISLHRDAVIDYPCGFHKEYPVCQISI